MIDGYKAQWQACAGRLKMLFHSDLEKKLDIAFKMPTENGYESRFLEECIRNELKYLRFKRIFCFLSDFPLFY